MAQNELIRASEIGQYIFCERAWWLSRVQNVPSTNTAELAAGTQAHERHGRNVAQAGRVRQLGVILLTLGIVFFLVTIFLFLQGT